jgi:hypothetical protein
MTMQNIYSPKPKVFGKGYGAHLSYNLQLVKLFIKLALQVFINAFIPGVYYEQAHWQVIDIYHKMRGFRHGTHSDHRCPECGADELSADETIQAQEDVKELKLLRKQIDSIPAEINEPPKTKPSILDNQPPTASEE